MKKKMLSALVCAVMVATVAVGCGKVHAEEAPETKEVVEEVEYNNAPLNRLKKNSEYKVIEVREYANDTRHFVTLILEDETSRVTIELEELLYHGESNESLKSAIKLAAGDDVIYNDGVFVLK